MDSPAVNATSSQKTFEIPELVAAIIRCVPQASLPSVARISRSWSEVALNRIWKNLPALLYLARVVHPLEYSSTTEHWHLSGDSVSPQWGRYQFYARRIRSLTYSDTKRLRDGKFPTLCFKVFRLLSSHGQLPLSIEEINWDVDVDAESIKALAEMLPASLTSLTLLYNSWGPHSGMDDFFKKITTRAPHFQLDTFLFFRPCPPQDERPSELRMLLVPFLKRSQPGISTLGICCDRIEPQVIVGIASLTELVRLNLWWNETASNVKGDIKQFVRLCPNIEEVELDWTSERSPPWNISPLLEWNLVDVQIEGHPSIGRRAGELERMATAWPHLHRLALNFDGYTRDPPYDLPLSTLSRIAILFPNLVDLAIQLQIDSNHPGTPDARFGRLRKLHVRSWAISTEVIPQLAAYLAAVCPSPDTAIYAEFDRREMGAAALGEHTENQGRWQETIKFVDKIRKAQDAATLLQQH